MLAFVFGLIANLLPAGGEAPPRPQRVASLNLCTDELLLMLGEPDRIVSVTHLSQQEAETPVWREARQYRRNDGSLLSVAAVRPDLVLTMGGGARDRGRIAARLGVPTLDLPYAASLNDVEANLRAVAAALGRPAAAEAPIARLDVLRRSAPSAAIDAIWLGGGGRTVSADGLEAQWMRLAGLGQRRLRGDRVSLELLAVRPPAVLLRSDYRQGQYSSGQRWLHHPMARSTRRTRTIATDGRRWTCMGPLMIDEIERLRAELDR